jgi:hypothetical protein
MKTFRHFSLELFAVLIVGCTAVMSFAGSVQDEERAGYQGIPVRNGLNRGIIQHDDNSIVRRYPRLPRRPNETDVVQPSSVEDDQTDNQNDQKRAGYGGIPQRSSSANGMRSQDSNVQQVERAGYGGIPQPVATNRQTRHGNNTLAAREASASLVKPK